MEAGGQLVCIFYAALTAGMVHLVAWGGQVVMQDGHVIGYLCQCEKRDR